MQLHILIFESLQLEHSYAGDLLHSLVLGSGHGVERLPTAPHLPWNACWLMVVWEAVTEHPLVPFLQCPRAFPSWWWPCSPCKPCSGWPRRRGWKELSALVGIPVVSPWLRPDYKWSKCLIFPFTFVLSSNSIYHLLRAFHMKGLLPAGLTPVNSHCSSAKYY